MIVRVFSASVMMTVLCVDATAQGDLKSRLVPITSSFKDAGTYHVATGTWTRGAANLSCSATKVVYNNSCVTGYFTTMLSTERWHIRAGRIPSNDGDGTPAPTTDSAFYGTTNSDHRYDARPGCSREYTINGFEVSYCSSHVGTIDWEYQFAHSYTVCGSDLLPSYTVNVTGLPGGTTAGGQNCWIVHFDVADEIGHPMILSADGDGLYDGGGPDTFGWSFGPSSTIGAADATGPVLAGNLLWTGGPMTGPLTPCTGTDGTIWDSAPMIGDGPTPPGELQGTGLPVPSFFRVSGGPTSPPSGPGCYYFGGNPQANFYLKLFATDGTCFGGDPQVTFCGGGFNGIVSCPCGNPQVPSAPPVKGCNNFAGGGTGGAFLQKSGVAVTNPCDTLAFNVVLGVGSSVTILFQGTTNTANTRSGAGVRCVGGTLKRLYKGNQSSGAIAFPNNGVSVHDQSAAKGFPIPVPVTLYYYAAYRNSAANGQPGCPGFAFGFNTTQAHSVPWAP